MRIFCICWSIHCICHVGGCSEVTWEGISLEGPVDKSPTGNSPTTISFMGSALWSSWIPSSTGGFIVGVRSLTWILLEISICAATGAPLVPGACKYVYKSEAILFSALLVLCIHFYAFYNVNGFNTQFNYFIVKQHILKYYTCWRIWFIYFIQFEAHFNICNKKNLL